MFFLILAVGLALSWAQLGKRAQLTQGSKISVMTSDQNCQPWQQPCAAYAIEFALVLGVESSESLRLVAEKLPSAAVLSLKHFEKSKELPEPQLIALNANQWLVTPSEIKGRLRVNVELGDRQWIAEFPLLKP